jgi:hypothetical protein
MEWFVAQWDFDLGMSFFRMVTVDLLMEYRCAGL